MTSITDSLQSPITGDLIVQYVERSDWVTFAELAMSFSDTEGDLSISVGENLVLWSGMSQRFVDALHEAQASKRLTLVPCSRLCYYHDGMSLSLPIAKQARNYKKPHWLVAAFRPVAKVPPKLSVEP